MAQDFGVGVRNAYNELEYLNSPPLSQKEPVHELPSATYKREMDKILPPAEGLTENLVDIAGQILVGSKTIPNIGIKNPAPAAQALRDTPQEVIKTGAKHEVPVYYDDVTKSSIAKKTGVLTDNVPIVGTGGGRATQQQAANKASENLANKYFVDDDVPELVQKGLQSRLNSLKTTAGKLYNKAASMLDPHGQVATKNFDDTIAEQLAKNERLGTAGDPEVAKVLQKYADAPRGDFTLMRELRSQLGAMVSDHYKGGSAIGSKGVDSVQAIKKALERDMEAFADEVGGFARVAWRKADSFYKSGIAPFHQSGLKQLVNADEPIKAWRYLTTQSAGKARAAKMYKALDPEGRAVVRAGLIEDAIEHARTPKGDVSPAKFALYMERHTNAVNQFFKGSDGKDIRGFQNLMRHIERAGQYAENPPTGNRVISTVAAGGVLFLNPATLLKIVGSTATVKMLFQTKAGRDILISASRMKPGSKPMQDLSRYIAATIATQSGSEE